MTIPARLLEVSSAALKELFVAPEVRVNGLPLPALPLVLAHLSSSYGLPILAAFELIEDALAVRDIMLGLTNGESLAFYPGTGDTEDVPLGFLSPFEGFRLNALAGLGGDEPPPYFLLTQDILTEGLPSKSTIQGTTIKIQPGATSYSDLRRWLEANGYDVTPLVTEPGTFALRGSIIDCYPVNQDAPVRMDFFGESLEEIREFDIHSQVSTQKRAAVAILSLVQNETERVPVFDHFPKGWILAAQEDEELWSLSTHRAGKPERTIDLSVEIFPEQGTTAELLLARWEFLQRSNPGSQILFVSDHQAQFSRAATILPEIPLQHASGSYPSGFHSAPLGLMVVTPTELWHRPASTWRPARKAVASLITVKQHIDTLEPGDPIVHVNYGIGQYQGLTHLSVGGTTQECLTIEYHGGDRVYVSTDKISLVFPYTFTEGRPPQLDSLHSRRWERIKRQTRRSAEEVIDQLAELYARRALATGISHPEDDEFQLEFEETFPFEDTPDQVRSTDEIKRDMEYPRPMDRLLCGDVGFGKTELALRAAFKAIRGGQQVALLAPTTILADQHFITFRARLEPFAVNVQMLSRFITPANQRHILKGISAGTVDIVIGTHRILSQDIAFKRLGLLIIDEEHRFGVKQKERIKELKTNVDVLNLSATPIPRTLQFSLAGIRDISHLDTPPLERIPVITTINYYSQDLIRRAVTKEIQRGGQVYFVHSEVKSIDRVARDLDELLAGVTIGVAHGQMGSKELETTMLAFSEGRFQLLVCTSIIESGIDLPNVNTVIINNAHRFGLSQLYQIRGRVGRSNRQAYAYLLIPRRPRLTREALKRLKTIERYTALGSGYAIALKDLEIRGTGNLFGLEQSGHVAAVGLGLYTRIIQGIARERDLIPDDLSSPRLRREEVSVRISQRASIPDSYVPDPHLRLNLYRRLSIIDSLEDLESFRLEITDRFGACPKEVEDLLLTARLGILSAIIGVRAVRLTTASQILIDFTGPENPTQLLQKIQATMEPFELSYRFQNLKGGDLRLTFPLGENDAYTTLVSILSNLRSG
ncbi:MAG: transcription-repair coupling factor [Candidatus Neomarinimicrobiota bacterium]